jgi:hypothetical protein
MHLPNTNNLPVGNKKTQTELTVSGFVTGIMKYNSCIVVSFRIIFYVV